MSRVSFHRCRCFVAACALLLAPRPLLALNPALDISQYSHTAWKIRDGLARAYVQSLAQTQDGYLWLATEFGLVRFDGVRSVAWQPPPGQSLPSTEVHKVAAGREGSLWIGTARGLVRLKSGTLTAVPELAGHIISSLTEARDGTVWAGTNDVGNGNVAKICAIRPAGVECHGDGRLGPVVIRVYEDTGRAIWMSVVGGVWRWTPGPPRFFPLPGELDAIQSLGEDDGRLLMGTGHGIRQVAGDGTEPLGIPGVPDAGRSLRVRALLRDRDGGLWIGTVNQGLVHIHEGRTDFFSAGHGLSGDTVIALFEDREGSIWVATVGGLDRFREVAVPTYGLDQGLSDGVVLSALALSDGRLWFSANGRLHERKGSQITVVPTASRQGGGSVKVHSLLQDRRGRVWVSSVDGLGYWDNDVVMPVPGVPAGSPMHALADDPEGNVWAASQRDGLFRVSRGGTVQKVPWDALGHKDFATALVADPAGGVWAGFQTGGLVHVVDGQVRTSYGVADGLGGGRVNTLGFDRQGALWAATAGGLSRWHKGRLATIARKDGLPCDAVNWTMDDNTGAIWLSMSCGLARVPFSDLGAWAAGVDDGNRPVQTLHARVFDSADGVIDQAKPIAYSPAVTRTADGKIWFTSLDGLAVVDPDRLPFNSIPPPVHVEQVTADRRAYELVANGIVQLPALTRVLQIDYTALSLAVPEKVRFRYRLEGHDRDWQDAGTRRQAFYTDLPPRTYRFRVIASNNDGVWNETGATIALTVAPAYYQTTWFLLLTVGTIVALVWGAHRVRLRMVKTHEREISALNERLMKAQEQERIRIAGELHDGVMQQMLAVTMMLGTAKRRITDNPEAAAETLDKVQEKLVQAGTDIRQLSHDLHPPALQDAGLPQAVRTYCEQFSAACGIPVSCETDDTVHELSRGAALALFRIMQEALGNAAKHAVPRAIAVRLTRADGSVALVVADDGAGFDASRLGTSGGLGLIMMRERASQLNGKFEFESTPGRGTTIRVSIPFR